MILVVGGTGLVGSRIVELLLANQQSVKIMARGYSDWKDSYIADFRRRGVEVLVGDVQDMDMVARLARDCKVVINCSGSLYSTPNNAIESVNINGTMNLVEAAKSYGIQRFIQVSCLGASRYSDSRYFLSKWEAEQAVKLGNFYWTIFRPSIIFADDCPFFDVLKFFEKFPLLPIVGSGLNQIQPVWADDVASCIVQSIYNQNTASQTYNLVGKDVYGLLDLFNLAASTGAAKPILRFPTPFGLFLAKLFKRLNKQSPIDDEVIRVINTDLIADPAIAAQLFKMECPPLESSLKKMLAKK